MSAESMSTMQAASARESNAAAARRGLWDALATTECGQPDVVRGFFESLQRDRHIVDVGCWNGAIAALAAASIGGGEPGEDHARAPWGSYLGVDVVPEAVAEFQGGIGCGREPGAVEGDIRALPLADASADVVSVPVRPPGHAPPRGRPAGARRARPNRAPGRASS